MVDVLGEFQHLPSQLQIGNIVILQMHPHLHSFTVTLVPDHSKTNRTQLLTVVTFHKTPGKTLKCIMHGYHSPDRKNIPTLLDEIAGNMQNRICKFSQQNRQTLICKFSVSGFCLHLTTSKVMVIVWRLKGNII